MANDKDNVKIKKGKPLGASGTDIFSGIITEEYNTQLLDTRGIAIYDEMRRSDATVRASVLATQLPIMRASWFVETASEDEKDIEIRDFIQRALFEELALTWDNFLRQTLLMLPFGVMTFEKVFEAREIEGRTMIVWKNFAPRMPKSIQSWELTDGSLGIQQLTSSGHSAEIPFEKMLWFINELEGENYWGMSILRAAYKPWYIKTNLERIDSVAHERQGLGIPAVKLPDGDTATDVSEAKTILKNLRANDKGYLLEKEGLEVEFKDMKANTTRDPHKSIAYHTRQIGLAVLAQFLDLGSGSTGSRALSQDQTELFLQSLEAIANNIKDTINKHAIKELVNLNFDNVEIYPQLNYAGISRIDVEKLSTAYEKFTKSGGLKAAKGDDQYIRGIIGLPERTEEDDEIDDNNPKPKDKDIDEDPEDPAKMSDIKKKEEEADLARKKFQENNDFKSWRKLTFAEKKVNFQSIQDKMDSLENSMNKESRTILNKAKDDYLKRLAPALEKKDTELIKKLQLKFTNEYKILLNKIMKDAYAFAKSNAAREMGVKAPANNPDVIRSINIGADTIAGKQAEQLTSEAKTVLSDRMAKGESVPKTIGAMEAAMAKAIDKVTRDTSSIVVAGNINLGRKTVFDKNQDKIYALQRSEVLDKRTCNFCLSIDERIIEKDDQLGKIGTFHSNCRGIWVEILIEEENKPNISGVPNSIRNRIGDATNELIQPKKPIIKKKSAAAEKINQGKAGQ